MEVDFFLMELSHVPARRPPPNQPDDHPSPRGARRGACGALRQNGSIKADNPSFRYV